MKDKLIVGSLEIGCLPEIGIRHLPMRVDTGAKTSSLHVDHLSTFEHKGKTWVTFSIHPDIYNVETIIQCEAALKDIRNVKSSNGTSEQRYVIETPLRLGKQTWPIDITLTNRSDMNYLMLLGREGMGSRLLVDPSRTFLVETYHE